MCCILCDCNCSAGLEAQPADPTQPVNVSSLLNLYIAHIYILLLYNVMYINVLILVRTTITVLLIRVHLQEPSSIHIDDLDEVVEEVVVEGKDRPVPHIGPVEGKILQGNDKRYYALEMVSMCNRYVLCVAVSVHVYTC